MLVPLLCVHVIVPAHGPAAPVYGLHVTQRTEQSIVLQAYRLTVQFMVQACSKGFTRLQEEFEHVSNQLPWWRASAGCCFCLCVRQ
jgi:hypothetical protein